ncbi:major facilitator superfamily domain-containing protein [Amanita rubescens]|nr:major facilitator superfamily domain-containing protein [Amanita rubescens]
MITSQPDSDPEVIDGQQAVKRQDPDKRKRTPLPWLQLSIVYLIQSAEPVAATVIYPFINQFVRETGIVGRDEKKTGYFAGAIESSFFFSEAATVIFWGMASDRFGRRPILILGPLGLAVAIIAFGMSTQFWPLVVFRCLQGTFNGNIGVSKTVIGEITDETNIADAFTFLPLVWSTASILGPILGGLLSRPAVQWPETLGKITYLRNHPYFLPCFAAAVVAFITFLCAIVGLEETLPAAILRKRQRQKKIYQYSGSSSSTSLIADDDIPDYGSNGTTYQQVDDSDTMPSATSLRDILSHEVLITLVNYGFLAFCDMCNQVLIPLMWSTSVEYWWPWLHPAYDWFDARHFGPRRVYIVCFSAFLISNLCFVGEGFFARQTGGADWRVWAIIVVQLCTDTLKYASAGSISVIVTGVAPSRAVLGTINGIAQALACVLRSLAPSVASSLFAISLQRGWAGGNAVYYIMLAITACGVRFSFMLPKTFGLQ